jgi:septal ring factor EnvC (AmiA/AmiB activator)
MRAMAAALLLTLAAGVASAQAPAADTPADEAARVKGEAETRQKLDGVRAQIKALAAEQKATETQKNSVAQELRERETRIAAATRELREIDARLQGQEQALAELESRRSALADKLKAQREALAALLRSAYAMGQHEELKLLLQQDNVATIARVLAYHRYFQNARLARIQGLLGDLAELARLQQAIETQRGELAATRAQREGELSGLNQERAERSALLAKLDASLKDQGARLAALGKDEQALVDLLEKLRDIFADIPKQLSGAEPFEARRGRMNWPLAGKILVGFGASDDSGRAISGLIIAARSGAEVHAISHGRVAYADWLKGYGLLLILDHGDGYMSLYGYNDTLLRDVGDWVNAGDIVATAGSSGGHSNPALYFELRQGGKPMDPRAWLRPSSR